jgi:hypothetical protein
MNALLKAVHQFLRDHGYAPSQFSVQQEEPGSMFKKNHAGEHLQVNIHKDKRVAQVTHADLLDQSLPLLEYFINN